MMSSRTQTGFGTCGSLARATLAGVTRTCAVLATLSLVAALGGAPAMAGAVTCPHPPCTANSDRLQLCFDAGANLCVQPGSQVTVTLSMSCLSQPVSGFQAFLHFDTTR